MAETDIDRSIEENDDDIPVITASNAFNNNWITIVVISLILIAEAVGAYTIIALNYPSIYEMVYDKPVDLGAFHEIKDITVNPAGTKGTGFLVISIGIQVKQEEDLQRIQQKSVVIRDAIITLLSRRTVEELSDMQSRNEVKQEIGIIINQIIERQAVKDLFFTKYVMQVY